MGQGWCHVLGGSTSVDPSQHKIKIVIIIVLKLDSRVNTGQGPITDQEGQPGLTRINIRIKIVIIIILKPNSGVNQDKNQVTDWEGQHRLT